MRLPMFPLGGVLLPGEALPLHVFEPRYRRLVHDVLAAPTPDFGVVLIERGSEVGGGDVRFGAGCLARVVRSQELPDGRWALVSLAPIGPLDRLTLLRTPDLPERLDRLADALADVEAVLAARLDGG